LSVGKQGKGSEYQPNFKRFVVELVREANAAKERFPLIHPNADGRVAGKLTAADVAAEVAARVLGCTLRPSTIHKFWKNREKALRP
jgi:hypothetical protein